MDAEKRLVAIVDDDPGVCRALARVVRSLGFDVETYASGEALLARRAPGSPTRCCSTCTCPGFAAPGFKFNLSVQRNPGLGSWLHPPTPLKAPMLIDLRADPGSIAPATQ